MTRLTKNHRPITFVRSENVERENRGFIVDQIDAVVDGKVVGYIKIENIPGKMFRRFYPTIFNYLSQIGGWTSLLPEGRRHVHYRDLTNAELVTVLSKRGGYSAPDPRPYEKLDRTELLVLVRDREQKFLNGEYGERYRDFRRFHVDKPFVGYIKVETTRQGIGTALYLEAAQWLAERGLKFRASGTQSPSAEATWASIEQHYTVTRDRQGRRILHPEAQLAVAA